MTRRALLGAMPDDVLLVQADGRHATYKHYNGNQAKENTMNAISTLTLAVILALSSASLALAGTAQPASESAQTEGPSGTHQATETAASMSEGEIKKVDKEAGKITIKHGPLTNLDMPAMTMVFRVKAPAILDQVKPGDKVRFVADKMAGAFTVIQLEDAR